MSRRSVLVVDDDPDTIVLLGRMLAEVGQLRFATNGVDALRLCELAAPDLILLDVEMPGMSGFEVCKRMKEKSNLADVPIIFVTTHDSEEHEVQGLNLGAVDFISKPIRAALVTARVRVHLRLKELSDALRADASVDGLTGIANRRRLDETLTRDWARALRTRHPLALLLIDVDLFKAYNDHYGHQSGDAALRSIASALGRAARRTGDLCARYGGEEFAVLLPDTDTCGAETVARRLLREVAALRLPHASSSVASHVTVSVGVATYDQYFPDFATPYDPSRSQPSRDMLVAAADLALYAAKRSGRNRAFCLRLDEIHAPENAVLIQADRGSTPSSEPDA